MYTAWDTIFPLLEPDNLREQIELGKWHTHLQLAWPVVLDGKQTIMTFRRLPTTTAWSNIIPISSAITYINQISPTVIVIYFLPTAIENHQHLITSTFLATTTYSYTHKLVGCACAGVRQINTHEQDTRRARRSIFCRFFRRTL